MTETEDILSKFDAITAMLNNVDNYFAELPSPTNGDDSSKVRYSQHKSITPELAAFLTNLDANIESYKSGTCILYYE